MGNRRMTAGRVWKRMYLCLESIESIANRQETMLEDVESIKIVTSDTKIQCVKITLNEAAKKAAKKSIIKGKENYLTQQVELKVEIS